MGDFWGDGVLLCDRVVEVMFSKSAAMLGDGGDVAGCKDLAMLTTEDEGLLSGDDCFTYPELPLADWPEELAGRALFCIKLEVPVTVPHFACGFGILEGFVWPGFCWSWALL